MSADIDSATRLNPDIRALEPADRGAVALLRHLVWHRSYGAILPRNIVQQHHYKKFFSDHERFGPMWVLSVKGRVLGCYSLAANCIDELVVDPAARRSGHGSALLSHALDQLRARDFNYAQVGLEEFNSAGIAFFRQAGWRQIASEPLDFPGGLRVRASTWSVALNSGWSARPESEAEHRPVGTGTSESAL